MTTGEAITITLNTPGELVCEADANPKPAGYITWTRPGFDLTGNAHEYVDGRGIMRVDNVTKAVSGMYLCHADNGIPPADTKNIQVIIQCELYNSIKFEEWFINSPVAFFASLHSRLFA